MAQAATYGLVALISLACACGGCQGDALSLKAAACIGRFFDENAGADIHVSVTDGSASMLLSEAEKMAMTDAVRSDTRPLPWEKMPALEQGSWVATLRIVLHGNCEALIIWLDPYGFSMGSGMRARIVNPSLARVLWAAIRSKRFVEKEFLAYTGHQILKGAGKMAIDNDTGELGREGPTVDEIDAELGYDGLRELRNRGTSLSADRPGTVRGHHTIFGDGRDVGSML